MKWKWEVQLFLSDIVNADFSTGRKVRISEVHASPPACLVLYTSLELAQPGSEFLSLLCVPKTSSLTEWKRLQGYWCHGGKNVFITAGAAGQTAAHSDSVHNAHRNLEKRHRWFFIVQPLMRRCGHGGAAVAQQQTVGWKNFLSRRLICILKPDFTNVPVNLKSE